MAFVIHLHLGSGFTAAEPATATATETDADADTDAAPSPTRHSSRWPTHSAYVDHLRRVLAALTSGNDAIPLTDADLVANEEVPPDASIAAGTSSGSP